MDCVAFLFCFCSLLMHVMCLLTPGSAPCHQSSFLEGKTFFFGWKGAVSQALKDCWSSDACCRVLQDSSGFGRQSCLGEMLGSPATPGPGLSAQGQGCHQLLPPWSGVHGERKPLWGSCGVVLTGAALWYLKRGYPLYVHLINGEYTEETLICVSNSDWEGAPDPAPPSGWRPCCQPLAEHVLDSQPQMWALAMSAAGPPRALPRGRQAGGGQRWPSVHAVCCLC